jgi:hypothetical protein
LKENLLLLREKIICEKEANLIVIVFYFNQILEGTRKSERFKKHTHQTRENIKDY